LKKINIPLLLILFSVYSVAECSTSSERDFISTFEKNPRDINKLEQIYRSCPSAPRKMFLHFAKGDAFEAKNETEYAFHEYAKALSAYGEINVSNNIYQNQADYLEEQKKKYAPKTAEAMRSGITEKVIKRGAGLATEYSIENIPLNFLSDSFEIKKGVNLEQAEEIYTVLSSKKYLKKKIYIMGFTDTSGTPKHNQKLSRNRAEALKTYLQNKGLKNDIHAQGIGEIKPICAKGEIIHKGYEYSCSIKEDKYKSRRVIITIRGE